MTRTVVHDISELHRARENLRRLGAEQQAIIDTDLVGIVKSKIAAIVWANQGAQKMFGWSLNEVAGQSTPHVLPRRGRATRTSARPPTPIAAGRRHAPLPGAACGARTPA